MYIKQIVTNMTSRFLEAFAQACCMMRGQEDPIMMSDRGTASPRIQNEPQVSPEVG